MIVFVPTAGNEHANPAYFEEVAEMLSLPFEELVAYASKKAKEQNL